MCSPDPRDPSGAMPPPGPSPKIDSLTRLRRALAQDAPSPVKRELMARSLLMNTRERPRR